MYHAGTDPWNLSTLSLKSKSERSEPSSHIDNHLRDNWNASKKQENLCLSLSHCPGRQWQQGIFKLSFLCKSYIDYCVLFSDDTKTKTKTKQNKKNLMLTPQVNWKYPFDSYQLCKKSNHKNKFWLWMCFNRSELTCKCRSFSYYSCAEPSTLRYLFRHISIFLGQS